MKIVSLNAATLPVYCRELGALLLDSIESGAQWVISQEHHVKMPRVHSIVHKATGVWGSYLTISVRQMAISSRSHLLQTLIRR